MIVKHLPDGTVAVGTGGALTLLKDGDAVCRVPADSAQATRSRNELIGRLKEDTDAVRAAKLAGYTFGEEPEKTVDLRVMERDLLHEELRRDFTLAQSGDSDAAERVHAHYELVEAGEATWPEDLHYEDLLSDEEE